MKNKKLRDTLKKYDKSKQSKETLISGILGITLGGSKIVEVPNRKGFVYVRLKGNTSELIQAFNATVSPVYDLPVFIVRNNSIYKVVGRNIDRYPNQFSTEAAYLPKHGAQHSFNQEIGAGGDVVWVYSQQFMPLLSYPSGSNGSMSLAFQPGFYEWNGQWRYAQNTGTPSYTPYLPTITGSARMVLSYLDPSDNSIKLVPGTPFSNSLTGSSQIAQYIPDIPREIGIPLAAVRLTTGTTSIGWGAIYDMRDFWTVGKPSGSVGGGGGGSSGLVGWDEGVYVATGTVLNVTGQRAVLSASGTVLNLTISPDPAELIGFYALSNGVPLGTGTTIDVGSDLAATLSGTVLRLNASAGGGGGSLGVVGWDEGVFLGTGTVFNFRGPNVVASISGTVVDVFVTGSSSSATPPITGSMVIYEDRTTLLGSALSLSFNNNITASISGSVAEIDVPIAFSITEDLTPYVNGTGTVFSLSRIPNSLSASRLYYNGVRQKYVLHYGITGTSLYTQFIPVTGSILIIDYDEIGSSSRNAVIQDEGIVKGIADTFNFVGAGVVATVSGTVVNVSVSSVASSAQTYFSDKAALLEPDAIETGLLSTFSYMVSGTSGYKYLLASYNTKLGSTGRFEVRDPSVAFALASGTTLAGLSSDAYAMVLNPSIPTYTDAQSTYYDRMKAIAVGPTRQIDFTAPTTTKPMLGGAYGGIITRAVNFDFDWLIGLNNGNGFNLANEINDGATAAQRNDNALNLVFSKVSVAEVKSGTERSGGAGKGSITFFLCPSNWSAVPDSRTYLFRDDFMGPSLSTGVWSVTGTNTVIDTTYQWVKTVGNGNWGANGAYSIPSVPRASGTYLMADVYVDRTATSPNRNFVIGFSDGAGHSYTNFLHGMDFTEDGGGNAVIAIFESGNNRGNTATYTVGCIYRIKITLLGNSAKYEIQGGTQYPTIGSSTWANVTPGTSSNSTTPLRAGMTKASATGYFYVSDMRIVSG